MRDCGGGGGGGNRVSITVMRMVSKERKRRREWQAYVDRYLLFLRGTRKKLLEASDLLVGQDLPSF